MRSTLLLVLLAVATCSAQPIRPASAPYRASATASGNSYAPVFSAEGRHVAFVSHANNLVTNDSLGPCLDLFVRDVVSSNTLLVSVSTNGTGGANNSIGSSTVSSNAQFVAFETAANNVAPGDANRVSDIYVRDLLAETTTLVSMNASGLASGNGPSSNPLISEDGRHVIFESLASNLVTNDFNGTNDIFIHDLTTGVTTLVSVNADDTASPDGPSHSPSLSANGLFVAFASRATNLVIGVTNLLDEIYVRDVANRTNLWAMAAHLRGTHSRSPASGALEPYQASEPVLNADGRYVAFKTLGQTVRFDLHRPTNSVVLLFTNNPPQWPSLSPLSSHQFEDNPRLAVSAASAPLAFTPDGRYLAYQTRSNVVPSSGVVLVDFESLVTNWSFNPPPPGGSGGLSYYSTNVVPQSQIVVTNLPSSSGGTWTRMTWVAVSADASRLCFTADATNLLSLATNRTLQLYCLDLPDGPLQLLSTNRNGKVGPDLADVTPILWPDGSLVAWDSPDDNIVTTDLNGAWDVFVRNVDTGETRLVSVRHPILPASSALALSRLDLNSGALSANGQRIALLSLDSTIMPNDTNSWRDLFVRDLMTGSSIKASFSLSPFPAPGLPSLPGNNAVAPFLSADGRYLAFSGDLPDLSLSTNRVLHWRDLLAPTNRIIASGNSLSHAALSGDGRFVAFHAADALDPFIDQNGLSDIYIYDANSAPQARIFAASVPNANGPTANGASIYPVFGPNGTWLLFQSTAGNLTTDPDTTPGRYQLYARQILTGQSNRLGGPVHLVSYMTSASTAPAGESIQFPLPGGGANPRFSGDSRYVAFEAGTNLIYRHDLHGGWITNITPHPEGSFTLYFTNRARITNDLVCTSCANPTLNSDGRFIAYQSHPPGGGITNIVVKDLQSGQEDLISVSLAGGAGGNASSFNPLLSYDARHVVFASKASDLFLNDTNRATDIFVRDRLAGVTHCLSANFAGTATGNRVSSNPVLSADGRTVAFQSFASDLVPGDYNDTRDVFVVTLAGPDSDGDGLDDDWEMAYFSTLSRDGPGDFDHDGASDRDEFRAGTNPANDASILRVLMLTTAPDPSVPGQRTTVVLWSAVPGRTYRVQFKQNLAAPWIELGATVFAGGTTATQTHITTSNDGRAFYRVLLVQ